jgi:hypothetical protein
MLQDNNFNKIKNEGEVIKKVALEKTIGFILTAFGLVAALAWNEAIKELIALLIPAGSGSIFVKFIYAVLVTLLVVVVSVYLTRLIKKDGNQV